MEKKGVGDFAPRCGGETAVFVGLFSRVIQVLICPGFLAKMLNYGFIV